MIKRTVTETVTEYDKDGNVVSQTQTVTEEEDTNYYGANYCPRAYITADPTLIEAMKRGPSDV